MSVLWNPPYMSLTWYPRPPVTVEVTWRPPQRYLHYHELYCGIYEYLRAPPSNAWRLPACEYLAAIRRNVNSLSPARMHLQLHRITWVQEWLKALPDDSDECSEAETEAGDDDS